MQCLYDRCMLDTQQLARRASYVLVDCPQMDLMVVSASCKKAFLYQGSNGADAAVFAANSWSIEGKHSSHL